MKISQIIDKIDENQLYVPAFQREFVWKRNDVKNLFSSLIKEYPVGTILSWETNSPPELKGDTKYNEMQGAVKLILDGQQRITALYMILKGQVPPYYSESEIKYDPRNLYVNVETLELEYFKKLKMQNNPLWIKLTDIFQKRVGFIDIVKTLKESQEVSDKKQYLIADNLKKIEAIPSRDFLEQSIPIKASVREAIDIFYIVNTGGVNLTEAELALAQISGYWPQARALLKDKLVTLAEEGFVFNLDFLVYVLLGVLHNMGSDMRKLHSEDNKDNIIEAWKKLDEKVLDYVFNMMRTQAYVDHTKEINSVYALIPIIVYAYNKDNKLSHEEIKKATKWFYYSQIRQRYTGQLPQKLDKDIGIVVSSESPFDSLLSIIKAERPLEITSDEFDGVGVLHPLFSLMRWYFKSKGAICLSTGLSIRKNMGKRYVLEWDHIFPYGLLKERGYDINNRFKYARAQEITNRAILTQTANRSKAAMQPDVYLKQVKEQFPSSLKLQSIPEDEMLWKLDKFEAFLEERRKILASELNEFLNNITESIETEVRLSVEELIELGENHSLELKSSLRWDYEESGVNKSLEKVIMKTISAFNNSDGGRLIIGINDAGEILGLQNDYDSLNGDKDKFEQHLLNLIGNLFSQEFASRKISLTFPTVQDNEICMVEVEAGDRPIFTKVKDKNGQTVEKFYIRRGNASVEIPEYSNVISYIKGRFDQNTIG